MPIHVNEIVIRAVVSDESAAPVASSSAPADQEALIAQCVEQVLAILKEKEER
jgi:hypothetical protein